MNVSTWRQTLQALDAGLELQPSASAASIAAAELRLGVTLPPDLRGLYEATDGIHDNGGQWFVMWQLEDLAIRNLEAWSSDWETEPRRGLLGFGDDGTGDPFCVELKGGTTVFHWSPIEQLARPLAPDLLQFWTGWFTGTIGT